MTDRATQIIRQYQDGLRTETNTIAALDAIRVRGFFGPYGSYNGYDYSARVWVTVPAGTIRGATYAENRS